METLLPGKITELARAVKSGGGTAMLVGGCVGDELMGATQSEASLSHCSMGKSVVSLTSPELQSAVSRSLLAKMTPP